MLTDTSYYYFLLFTYNDSHLTLQVTFFYFVIMNLDANANLSTFSVSRENLNISPTRIIYETYLTVFYSSLVVYLDGFVFVLKNHMAVYQST